MVLRKAVYGAQQGRMVLQAAMKKSYPPPPRWEGLEAQWQGLKDLPVPPLEQQPR